MLDRSTMHHHRTAPTTRATVLPMQVRAARPEDVETLAQLWYDGWHDVHVDLVPMALTKLRTRESFRDRAARHLDEASVGVDDAGTMVGFFMLRDTELYQFYVAAPARGTGAAATLMEAAEDALRADGVAEAHLGCAIGNDRAARFYEKNGWKRAGATVDMVETSAGPFKLEVWRYEKVL
jgi:GNAT superfamily N-acetyltransferase